MNVIHIFLLTVSLAATRSSAGYEVINNEIIERIDLDNGQDLQLLPTSGKPSQKVNQHVEKVTVTGEDGNSVQNSPDGFGLSGQQPSIIYAAIQAIPRIVSTRNGQMDTDEKTTTTPVDTTEKPRDARKSHSKLEDPSEDKSKNIKAKLYTHMKQSAPKVNALSVETTHDTPVDIELTASIGEVATMKNVIIQPYATIIDEEKDLRAEQSEEPYVVYDKNDYLKPEQVRKTVKTHKIGDEKKSIYPKQEIRLPTPPKEKDDMETDNTIWIGYGLGVPAYRYPYNYPSSLYGNSYYAYGRPYSGWTRGYTGSPYYENYRTGYAGSSYNNYGTGFGSYGGYL